MKKLIALLAVAFLSGCAYVPYGSPYYGNSPYGYSGSPYYYDAPYYGGPSSVFIYGSSGGVREHRPWRDHDRGGARFNRDRDRDGVPNRRDAFPNDPRRY